MADKWFFPDWILKGFTQKIPEEYREYSNNCKSKQLLKTKLSEIRFVVLDTEATGLDVKKDRILSIGAVAVKNYSVLLNDSFEAEIKQEYYNKESILVHEITPGRSAHAKDSKKVMQEFLQYLSSSVIIAHYLNFDYQMISKELKLQIGIGLHNRSYDTMWLLKRVDAHFQHENLIKKGEYQLETLCKRYQIPMEDQHTAMGDAFATALLFARLLKKLELRGVKTLGDLLRR